MIHGRKKVTKPRTANGTREAPIGARESQVQLDEVLRLFAANDLFELRIMRLVVSAIARSGDTRHLVVLSFDLI